MRLNSPIGILLLLWPPFWVITYAQEGNIYNSLSLIFLVGIITTRTIGCVINDFFDKNFDKHVDRTKNRPYASNLVSKKEVLIIFAILSIININLLLLFIIILSSTTYISSSNYTFFKYKNCPYSRYCNYIYYYIPAYKKIFYSATNIFRTHLCYINTHGIYRF